MDLVKKTVRHAVFGQGTICGLEKDILSVRFDSDIKKFIFPDAFRKHLVPNDEKSKQYVKRLLDSIDMEQRRIKEEEIWAVEKRKRLENIPTYANAQTAFGFLENSREAVLEKWSIYLGSYRSGLNRGKPRSTSYIYPNSACLLTCREENSPEENRIIWGVFMVKQDYWGSMYTDGMIPAHDKYRSILSEEESKQMLFWSYFQSKSGAPDKRWGVAEAKRFSNITMAKILCDILEISLETAQRQERAEFFKYFCELNRISKSKINDW